MAAPRRRVARPAPARSTSSTAMPRHAAVIDRALAQHAGAAPDVVCETIARRVRAARQRRRRPSSVGPKMRGHRHADRGGQVHRARVVRHERAAARQHAGERPAGRSGRRGRCIAPRRRPRPAPLRRRHRPSSRSPAAPTMHDAQRRLARESRSQLRHRSGGQRFAAVRGAGREADERSRRPSRVRRSRRSRARRGARRRRAPRRRRGPARCRAPRVRCW